MHRAGSRVDHRCRVGRVKIMQDNGDGTGLVIAHVRFKGHFSRFLDTDVRPEGGWEYRQ